MSAQVPHALHGERPMERLAQLATCSEVSGELTRTFLTDEHRAAAELLKGWTEQAGMQAGFDAIGNMIERYEALSLPMCTE